MLSIYDLCGSTLTQFTVNRGFCRWYQAGRRARPGFCHRATPLNSLAL